MSRLLTAFRRCLSSVATTAPSPGPTTTTVLRSSVSASSIAAVTAASMVAYTSAVAVLDPAGDIPEDGRNKIHHVKDGSGKTVKFQNPYPSAARETSPWSIAPKILWLTITGKLKMPKPDPSKPETLGVSVVTPNLPSADATRTPPSKLRATWLGHACYFVEFPSGLRVLFDPVFESRCGPHGILGPPRYTPPACSLADLPPVDAVIISHSHYDHLSLGSVKTLAARNPQVQFFVGLGLAKWFRSSGIERVTEMDWWQDAELTLTKKEEGREAKAEEGNQGQQSTTSPDVSNPASTTPNSITARITCLPCQHASGRTGFDFDTTLWASWSVKSGDKSVWFAGDTGYRLHTADSAEEAHKDDNTPDVVITHCPQFKQIGELRGPFDLALIPIGAYRPRYLFSWMHADPYDAVDIFRDTRCRRALGMHWGTWVLTYEEVDEPPRLLKKALKERGLEEEGVFEVCGIGETREF